jgi:DNA-binding SARP family transcriptional activator
VPLTDLARAAPPWLTPLWVNRSPPITALIPSDFLPASDVSVVKIGVPSVKRHLGGVVALGEGTTVIYRLLGELQIGPDDGLADLPCGPTLIILADLLMHANKRVSKIRLIRVAWGKDDVDEAQLHKRVSVIRKMLTEVGHGDDLKTHARFGYELRADEADLDTLLFHRLVAQAQQAREQGAEWDTDEEIRLLRAALRLWRGAPPLSNVPSDAFYAETAELARRRKRAAVRLFELEISRGHYELILDELSAIAGQYPADQRLTEQLMVAAYRCGHPADVSTTYERYRKAIDDETGGPPDHLIKAFHFAVARGDGAAAAMAESDMAKRAGTSMRSVPVVPRQLPPAVALVGRQALVATTSELLGRTAGRTAPVVAISGPGGIGKTALAVTVAHELADQYPDGQLYAQLHGTGSGPADTAEVLSQFLRALGVPMVPEAKQERLMSYRSLLAERRVLIVLDDALSEEQVNDLIPASPGCAVLITARQRLPGTSAFHVPPLEPLGQQDATELFLSVLRDAGIGPDDDPAALARVVRICAGLPLALRIVAALRVRDNLRPAEELARRLAERGPEAFARAQRGSERGGRTQSAQLCRAPTAPRTRPAAPGGFRPADRRRGPR